MEKSRVLFFVLIFGFIIQISPAQTKFGLNNLIDILIKNNLLLSISELDHKIVREEYRSAKSLPNPEVEYSRGQGDLIDSSDSRELWGIGLKLSIPNPIYRYYLLKSAKGSVTRTIIQKEIKKRHLIKLLKHHFFRLQLNKKFQDLFQERSNIMDEILRITKAKVRIGESKEIDFLRTSVEKQKLKTSLFKLEKSISVEKMRINELLNFTLPEDYEIDVDFNFTPFLDLALKITYLVEKSVMVELKKNAVFTSKNRLKSNWYSLLKSFHLFGEKGKDIDANVWRVGIEVSVPLFNIRLPEIRKAKLEKKKADIELEYVKKNLFFKANRIIAEIKILEAEIEMYKEAVLKEGQENADLSEKLYKAGEIPLIVYLDSQSSFFELQERFFEAITEWKILKAEFEELLGEKK